MIQSELGVVFLHFRDDPCTVFHRELVQKANPTAIVIPVASSKACLFGSHNLVGEPGLWSTHGASYPWSNADLMLYQWYENRKVSCKKWVVIEWDTRCNISFAEYFGEAWDQPAVAPDVYIHKQHPWYWFDKDFHIIPENLKPNAAGMSPVSCLLFKDEVLDAMVRVMKLNYTPAFSELRLGTLARHVGATPVRVPNPKGKVTWQLFDDDPSQPGIWHPVKGITK